MEKRKYLGRYDNDLIKSITSKVARIDGIGIAGYAALVRIKEVNRPRMVGEQGSEVCIADNGYSELSFLPDNENWYLTAVYDDNNDVVEWYFDITRKNAVDEKGNPYCDDLYLDAVLLPNGQILVLDEDELKDALYNGNISRNEFDMAYRVLDELRESNMMDIAFLRSFCPKLRLLLTDV